MRRVRATAVGLGFLLRSPFYHRQQWLKGFAFCLAFRLSKTDRHFLVGSSKFQLSLDLATNVSSSFSGEFFLGNFLDCLAPRFFDAYQSRFQSGVWILFRFSYKQTELRTLLFLELMYADALCEFSSSSWTRVPGTRTSLSFLYVVIGRPSV